uniref:PiggyBac transposable element-derived protein 4 C-terminal zinc-finger domain-containing protein n=1 Tax=Cuerna arida TaxID=1464854 RepID=A0A1B6F9X5_9HEMI
MSQEYLTDRDIEKQLTIYCNIPSDGESIDGVEDDDDEKEEEEPREVTWDSGVGYNLYDELPETNDLNFTFNEFVNQDIYNDYANDDTIAPIVITVPPSSSPAPESISDVGGLVSKRIVQIRGRVTEEMVSNRSKPNVPIDLRHSDSRHQPTRTTRRRCAACSTKKKPAQTMWMCSICKVPLCLGKKKTCFQQYHGQEVSV